MTYHNIPSIPEGWVTSTNTEKHIAFVQTEGEKRCSLALYPTNTSNPELGWTVLGLANYEPFRPVFTDTTPLQEATAVAMEEMKAKNRDNQIDHIRKAGTHANTIQSTSESNSESKPSDADKQSTESQSGLDRWV